MLPATPLALLLRCAAVLGIMTRGDSVLARERGGTRASPARGGAISQDSGNSTVAPPLHEYMMSLYQMLSTLRRGDRVPRASAFTSTVTSFVDKEQDRPGQSGQRYVFDLSSLSLTADVTEAQLRILRKPDLRAGGNVSYSIRLYLCAPEATSGTGTFLASRPAVALDGTLPSWEVFDVGAVVRARLAGTEDRTRACFYLLATHGRTGELADPLALGLGRRACLPQEKALLVVHARDAQDDSLMEKLKTVVGGGGGGGSGNIKSIRTSVGRPNKHRLPRKTRAAAGEGAAGPRDKQGRCGRRSMRVNFRELGWDDWIIAPLQYEARRCDGACQFPLRAQLEPTNHAVIQTLVHSADPAASPASCCVPSATSAVGVLYLDAGGKVAYRQYADMVVERCGCR